MGASAKKQKKVIQSQSPKGKIILDGGNPNQYYSSHPSWNFSSCDKKKWSIWATETKDIFWSEIFPHLQSWEGMTWSEILVAAKKQNHTLDSKNLSKSATDRLSELYVEADSLISLRMTGTHRLYGFMSGSAFNILWVDLDHGDNENCVCRSYKKNT